MGLSEGDNLQECNAQLRAQWWLPILNLTQKERPSHTQALQAALREGNEGKGLVERTQQPVHHSHGGRDVGVKGADLMKT